MPFFEVFSFAQMNYTELYDMLRTSTIHMTIQNSQLNFKATQLPGYPTTSKYIYIYIYQVKPPLAVPYHGNFALGLLGNRTPWTLLDQLAG